MDHFRRFKRVCQRFLQCHERVVLAHEQLIELVGDSVERLSVRLGLENLDSTDPSYLLAVAVCRCILVHKEYGRPGLHHPVPNEDGASTGAMHGSVDTPELSSAFYQSHGITGTSLVVSLQNPSVFFNSLLFSNIHRIVGVDLLTEVINTHRVLVPYDIFRVSCNTEFRWLLGHAASPDELILVQKLLLDLLDSMDSRVPQLRLGQKPLIVIQCSGSMMYNNNFWVSKKRTGLCDIVLSRHVMFYKDSFNHKFGFRPCDMLGALLQCVGRYQYQGRSVPCMPSGDSATYPQSGSKLISQELIYPVMSINPSGHGHRKKPTLPSSVDTRYTRLHHVFESFNNTRDWYTWYTLRYILFDKKFFDPSFHERRSSMKSFIRDLSTGRHITKPGRIRGSLLRGLFKYFKMFIDSLCLFDVGRAYRSCLCKFPVDKGSSIATKSIVAFVHLVIDSVVPVDLLGCLHNFLRFKQVCHSLVVLNKGERLDMSQVMYGFRASGCSWYLSKPSRLTKGQTDTILCHLSRLVFFLLEHLVIPLLQRHFYVTESNFSMYRLHYFSKLRWHQMVLEANAGYISDVGIQVSDRVPPADFSDPLRIRWIPKVSGMRPILNCNYFKVNRGSVTGPISVNDMMHIPFHALRAHVQTNPKILGNSILGYSGAYISVKRWWRRFRRNAVSWSRNGIVTIYIILADLSRCYERIDHKRLMLHLEKIRFRVPMGFNMVYRRDLIRLASSCNSYSRRITVLSNTVSSSLVHQKSLLSRRFGQVSIYSPQVVPSSPRCISMPDVIRLVRTLLGRRVSFPKCSPNASIHNGVGIPQGCCISPLLCSLYLSQGDFNADVMNLTHASRCNLLLRWIDDFMFISANPADNDIMLRLLRDSNTFGVSINDKLVTLRLDVPVSKVDITGSATNASCPSGVAPILSWINCTFDFDFVLGKLNATLIPWKNPSCSIRDSLNLSRSRFSSYMFAFIEQRLLGYISNRLNHGLFTSLELNTRRCVLQNVYVVMRICMMKLLVATDAVCRHFGGFVNIRYLGRLCHKLLNYIVGMVLRITDMRRSGLRQVLQLAVIYTLSPGWIPRLSRRYGRRRIRFIKSIERKFHGVWPSYD
ncbi:Telomerase ribonucleoprotein complex - RNA binding domain family protein [Babesia bovis T2Bo]|uniref:Telomerase reverse transcriptase n=1 Tax=Babesia bovis TaxID=5865 RepID=A7AWY3_BABBO|nr:Telomerase ribonucleoprotein complex - RNA binding domain family protein [Babesia bovis T2Bo]EDO05561.1 Telomerase ribonucleoprotein complex - RNA binding domain family protein [Babesia bovis T2Bo]|eukprot:XP_001609129.1 hypothetical protein [Babesia bovis T2Bo]